MMPTTRSASLRGWPAGLPGRGGLGLASAFMARQAAQVNVQPGGGGRRQRDLARAVRPRQPPGQHLGNVQLTPPAVQRCLGDRGQVDLAARPDRLHVQPDHRGDLGHARQPGQRGVVAAYPGPGRRDQQVRGVRGVQEAGVGTGRPPRPRGRGQHSATGHRDEQDEYRPARPAGPELMRGQAQHYPHRVSSARPVPGTLAVHELSVGRARRAQTRVLPHGARCGRHHRRPGCSPPSRRPRPAWRNGGRMDPCGGARDGHLPCAPGRPYP